MGADTLAFASTAGVFAANGSHVEGPMARTGAGTFLFPVGRAGDYLPIKFFNSTSTRVGVVVEAAPVGYTTGDAVESQFGFPHAWKVTKAMPGDTANFIEVKIPDALLSGVSNPIPVRKVLGQNQFEGMGSRLVSASGGATTIQSYSSGLQGLFSIANGYSGNLVGDSTELVALYNLTNGNSWTNKTNWRTTGVRNWFGVTEKGGRVTRITMPNNNIVGPIPPTLVNMTALNALNLQNNGVTSLPDLTVIPALITLDVSNNKLDFGSLEKNATLIAVVTYENQAPLAPTFTTDIPVKSNYELNIPVGGTTNEYTWRYLGHKKYPKDVVVSTSESHTISAIDFFSMGDYVLEVTNPQVPGLLLKSGNQRILATANIEGTLFANSTTPAVSGTMRLLQVTTTGAYDSIQTKSVASQAPDIGKYIFDNVLLDYYVINGFADTLRYNRAIPTWFENSIFWEEADTIFLNNNLVGVNIISESKPDPPTAGQGVIEGTFFADFPGGRTEVRGRVKSAAVAVRRVERTGRGKGEVLTLVAYTFTNDQGEFSFSKLDVGTLDVGVEYRINFQYPGYPMDTTSFVKFVLKNNLFDRQVGVEAEVINKKIVVRKLIITGWEEEEHSLNAYPNPTAEYLFITEKTKEKSPVKFQLIDASGKTVDVPVRWDGDFNRWELRVKDLKPGVFVLRVQHRNSTETLRIVIQ